MIVVFGEKWAFAAPVLAWLAVSKGIMSPCGSFIPYLKATGHASTPLVVRSWASDQRTDRMILGTWFYGLVGLCVAMCIVNLGILFAYLAVVLRVAGLALRQGIKDVMVPLVIAAVMALAVRLSLARPIAPVPHATCPLAGGSLDWWRDLWRCLSC